MPRYLVVANQTLGGDHLLELLRDRAAQGDATIHVLVPATVDQTHWTSDEETDHALARLRLDLLSRVQRAVDVPVTHVVGERTEVTSG